MKKEWIFIGTSLFVLSGLIGCSSQESAPKSLSEAVTASESKGPVFSVEGLIDGEKVKAGDLKIAISLTGHDLVNFKDHPEAKPGQGHIHIWLDKDANDPKAALKVIQDPNQIILKNVQAGDHTLVIGLVGNDHKPIEGSQTQEIHFSAE